jgi:cysteine desulfuration protein SufE
MSELHDISTADLIEYFSLLPGWEEKFRYIIDLGKKLPAYPDDYKDEQHQIYGCQSTVWLKVIDHDSTLSFQADADAAIVRGLIAILMIAYNNQTPDYILKFDVKGWLESLGLLDHLTPTRSNGLNAMIKRIQSHAKHILEPDVRGI